MCCEKKSLKSLFKNYASLKYSIGTYTFEQQINEKTALFYFISVIVYFIRENK